MSTYRLDTDKLMRDVDRARHAGAPDEVSYRQIAAAIGGHSSMFGRLARGMRPSADALCSLLMWLNPQAPLSHYTVVDTRARAAAQDVQSLLEAS